MLSNESFWQGLVDDLLEGVYFVDRDRRITYWNSGAERLTGYSEQEVLGRSCADGILRHVTADGVHLCRAGCPLAATIRDGRSREADLFMHHSDGHRVPVTVRAHPMRGEDGEILGSAECFAPRPGGVFSDLESDRRTNMAFRDPVTRIGNRLYAEQQLAAVMGSLEASTTMGLLFCDVDRFKTVNDTWGHTVGDKTLRMVARTLANGLRPGDVPCRWGGEEFIAVLPETDGPGTLRVAERIRMLVENSWLALGDTRLSVTVSVGATVMAYGETVEGVLERVDQLMYRSKHEGRNRVSSDIPSADTDDQPVLLPCQLPAGALVSHT